MDNLSDILANKNLREPPETKLIKEYVLNKYDEHVGVQVDLNKIIILVNNSALASSIRMCIPEIQKICGTKKQIAIYLNS
jgi:hypothetical protein